jgi:hypothetical protein
MGVSVMADMSERRGVRIGSLVTLLGGLAMAEPLWAAEYIRQESPQPANAKDLEVSIQHAFADKNLSEGFLMSDFKDYLEDKPEFWRDAKVRFDLRNYLFERRNSSNNKPEAFVIGGKLSFESGWWNDLGVKAAFYNSTELDADGPDTGLLESGHDNINVLGEANVRYRITNGLLEGSEVALFRQTLDLPFINKHDIRQIPATHEAYTVTRVDSDFDYIVGHITEFKDYDSDEFVNMSEAAGAPGSDEGVSLAGARTSVGEAITVGAANYYGHETFNTFFTEGTYHAQLTDNLDMRVAAQFTDQRSVGDELVGDFDTRQFAAKAAFGWRGAVVTFAASVVDDEAGIRKPWGGTPSYLSIQRLDFDRAGEKSLLFGLSYNTEFFSSLGLSSYINIARGWDAENPTTGAGLPDRMEYDVTVDYKPPSGFLEGLWLRARYNWIDTDGDGENIHDFRLIINYTLPFL